MAGTMRKMAVYLGLVEDQDRYGEYGEYTEYGDGEYDDGGTADRRTERGAGSPRESSVVPSGARRPVERVSAVRELDRITTLHPRTYNEARTIGEHFREGTPVIMNLTEMDDNDAKRLVDFAAGLIFGLRGSIERVTQKVFLLSPQNVTVTAEDKARIAEGGFFNQSLPTGPGSAADPAAAEPVVQVSEVTRTRPSAPATERVAGQTSGIGPGVRARCGCRLVPVGCVHSS